MMAKRFIAVLCVVAFIFIATASFAQSKAAETTAAPAQKEGILKKIQKGWQKLFSGTATATQKTIDVVADTTKKGTKVVSDEFNTVGKVSSGELGKSKDLAVGPVEGSVNTVKDAATDTANIPVEAVKSE